MAVILLGFSAARAEEALNRQKATSSLYMRSAEGDFIGEGKVYEYLDEKTGHFRIYNPRGFWHSPQDAIEVVVGNYYSSETWNVRFVAPKDKLLQPGFYKTTERFHGKEADHYELNISGYGRGCTSIGEFEILEVKRNAYGEIVSFAANFVQRCEKNGLPLYGSVRYNSEVPVEARFTEFFSKKADFRVYFTKYNPTTEKSQPLLISKGENSYLTLKPLRYQLEGIEISIDDKAHGSWNFKFSPQINDKFAVGSFENATNYPFRDAFRPRMEILIPWVRFNNPHFERSFKVLEFVRGEYREIQSLALDFMVQNYEGEILQGSIRFNSKVPFNPENLCGYSH